MRSLRDSLTTRGACFLAAGLVLLLAGLALGQRDLTRIGVLLLVLPVGAWLLGRRHSLRLEVQRVVRPSRVAVDEPAVVTATLRNPEGARSPVLLAEEHLDHALGERPRFVVAALGPGDRGEVQYAVRAGTRGAHALGPLRLRVRDPFGLSVRSAAVGERGTLVVLPRIHPLGSGRQLGRGVGAEGSIPHRVALHGEDDQAIREYRDGDDLRRIHWPATARTGELMVRQEDRPARRRAVILLDSRRDAHGGTGPASSLEWSVEMAASVTAHLIDLGYTVHLITPDAASDSGTREDTDLEPVLDTLARLGPDDSDGFRAVLHAAHGVTSGGGLVVAVVAGLDDDAAHATASLRQPGSTGVAFVVDGEAFGGRPALGRRGGRPTGLAPATAAALAATGWAATLVRPGTTPPQAWGAVVGAGMAEAAR
ncbi:MAG TPA: DUF58 domain-containing protein [Dermatophilaceae bacterium]|nr:DUF58 domain-containing protein [Dermatophilaceae bacterium]